MSVDTYNRLVAGFMVALAGFGCWIGPAGFSRAVCVIMLVTWLGTLLYPACSARKSNRIDTNDSPNQRDV